VSSLINQQSSGVIRIGIDATNIRIGGGITHLLELLNAIDAKAMGVQEVVIWAGSKTLQSLPDHPWMTKINPPSLDKSLFHRALWQLGSLTKAVREAQCDVLLVPGGSYVGGFHPVVAMSQNLFPFEWSVISRTGLSLRMLKFIVLRWVQSYTFKHSDGVIFLTQYAKEAVLKITGPLLAKTTVIAHGLSTRFSYDPKPQLPLAQYDVVKPFHIIYVSTIEVYKNQDQVVLAVELLRKKGFPLSLTLVGPAEAKALNVLNKTMDQVQEGNQGGNLDEPWCQYLGAIPYEDLSALYKQADLAVFASSCETFGMIVLEQMAIGLPIACSDQSAMPEILGEGGIYFDPRSPASIASAIEQYLASPELREKKQLRAYELSKAYSWQRCAQDTVSFLRSVVVNQKQ
jgi:glycosyltransferase involved in cell wall biosynthesis